MQFNIKPMNLEISIDNRYFIIPNNIKISGFKLQNLIDIF